EVKISDTEIDYLCAAASEYFAQPVKRSDIVWTYSAVRPLYDDGASKAQEATRDYVLKADGGEGAAPLLNAFGGKITTFRRLAESMLENEWAITAEDVLWRRTKRGLHFSREQTAALEEFMRGLSSRHVAAAE
ncbi:MAG: hypothetical protein E5X00_19100, partial [Mesorhizobium sp.]